MTKTIMLRDKMTVRWGVVGPGRIARTFAKAMQDKLVGEIVAVASSNKERAQNFANEFNVSQVFNSYKELFESDSIDAVYIATTHNFHFELAMKAIAQHKHLLVEKPITINHNQALQLFTAAKANNVFVMEALWSVFLPAYQQVRQWLDEDKIGEVTHLSSSFGFLFPRDYSDRLFDPVLAGGTLLDMGVYNIATSLWLMKQYPESIASSCLIGPTGVDETTSIQLSYKNGVVHQAVSCLKSQMVNDFLIYGDKGYIRIQPNFWGSEALILATEEQTITKRCPFDINGFEYQIRHFEDCLRQNKLESEIMSHDSSVSALKIMDKVREQNNLIFADE